MPFSSHQDFSAETKDTIQNVPLATPPFHILPTNQETLSYQGPSTSGPTSCSSLAQQPMSARAYCAHPSILGAEVHEQVSRSGDQSQTRCLVFKSPMKLGTHLSIHCSGDERLSRPCLAWE
ncbi:hypothetical protein TNCV_2361341 [Trichonephila clavipes]|nr:hypothetical protein TNCV_2361341 [Trichonephila clavipes]